MIGSISDYFLFVIPDAGINAYVRNDVWRAIAAPIYAVTHETVYHQIYEDFRNK